MCLFVFGCSTDDYTDAKVPLLESVSLLKSLNLGLDDDVVCHINDNDTSIVLYGRHLNHLTDIVLTFKGNYDLITNHNGEVVESGVSKMDFRQQQTIYISKGANKKNYSISVLGYNGLPVINIETKEEKEITSKTDYVNAIFDIVNYNNGDNLTIQGQIKGRGNATWVQYPKKPYKIKLSESKSLFEFAEEKDWVLLADYTDKSLLRTTYMSEISKAVGLRYTINCKHVELYINKQYQGTYILTEQVEKTKNRINVEKDGYIIEDDTYYSHEPYYFTTLLDGRNYTFKYPDVSSKDEKASFIENYMNEFENSLKKLQENPENLDYYNYIDVPSFAKWYIVSELTGNLDPNLFYVLYSKRDKLLMMPLWDSEWSLGLACKGNPGNPYGWYFYDSHAPMQPNEEFWKNELYFKKLFLSPSFVKCVKEQWTLVKPGVRDAISYLKEYRNTIVDSQEDNFKKWPILNEYLGGTLIVCGGWANEVNYIENWIDERILWFDNYVANDFVL